MKHIYFNENDIEEGFKCLKNLMEEIKNHEVGINDIHSLIQAGWSQNGAGKKRLKI